MTFRFSRYVTVFTNRGTELWESLEAIPGGCAVAAAWQRWAQDEFPAFRTALLQPMDTPAESYPCPRECGCMHDLVYHADGRIVAVCDCEEWNCDDISLQPEDVVVWQSGLQRLGRAIVRALELDRREQKLNLPWTMQVGSWSAAGLPVILTICYEPKDFQSVVAHLAARMRDGFLLFAPTNRFLDATIHELLAHVRAGFFSVESNFTLLPSGLLHARQSAGKIFARWAGKPTAPGEDTVRQAFAIVKALDSERPQREASMLTVFRLYCVQGLTAEATAQRCGCSKSTILNRLNQIQQRIGVNPANLRIHSAHFEALLIFDFSKS